MFDNVQLIRDFSQSYQYDDDGNLVTTNDYVNEQASVKYNTHDKVFENDDAGCWYLLLWIQ